MEREQKSDIYNCETFKKASGTDNVMLRGEPIPKGRICQFNYVIGKDETTAGKTIRVGYERGGTAVWLIEEPASTNFHGVVFDSGMVLVENERPIAMIESPTDADLLYLYARGVYL